MSNFDLKIRYPHHLDLNDIEVLGTLDTIGILTKFDKMGWRQQLIRWLQLDGASPSFIITNATTEQTLEIVLDTYGSSQQLEFKLHSDIPVVVPRKDMFGLITRQSKEMIRFDQLSLAQVKSYLTAFLRQDIHVLAQHYQQSKELAKSA